MIGIGLSIGIPFGTYSQPQIPSCASGLAVSWHKNLNTTSTEGGTLYVKDEIGTRTDTVYYGQYLDNTSGQINFYRDSGTFDYTKPSDGTLVEDIVIPASGLYTIPTNGICDIVTSDGSEYPVCERAGTVLHDTKQNAKHISVAAPSWSETLYGSDYLNQYGYVDKTANDALSYAWETDVNGVYTPLHIDTLVPLITATIGDYVYDELTGDQVFDEITGEPVYEINY